MKVGMGVMATGLVGAIQLTHAIVPPTPGPLAAAALVGADIGKTIIFGGIACMMGSLSCWIWGQYIAGPRIKTLPSSEYIQNELFDDDSKNLPGTLSSYAPIVIPVILIAAQSVSKILLNEGNIMRTVLGYIGWPVLALSIGVWLAYRNITNKDDRAKAKGKWVEDGLRTSAMILVVTGLGGSLSEILKATPAVTTIGIFFADHGLPSIFLPFILGIIGNMITGSTTVGVITAASLIAPMLAGAPGSVIIKYVNSSYFWVCTSLSKLTVAEAILSYGGATLIGGCVTFATIYLMWSFGFI